MCNDINYTLSIIIYTDPSHGLGITFSVAMWTDLPESPTPGATA